MTIPDALLREAQELQQAGRLEEAERAYRRLLEQNPQCAEAHFLLGCMYVRAGRAPDGVPALVQAARLLPGLADAHIVLGNVLISLGRWSEAVDALQRAIALQPDAPLVKCNLALALYSSGAAAQSEALYEEILKAHPESVDAHGNLAHILNEQARYAEAEGHARRAVELAPANALLHNILGVSLSGMGHEEAAEQAYRLAIGLDARLSQASLNLASLYRNQGRHAEAEHALRRALEQDPACAAALDALGFVLMDVDRFDEAIDCFSQATALQPQSGALMHHLAIAYRDKGKFEEAVTCGLKAAELDPRTRHSLALDQIRTGRYREGWSNLQGEEVPPDGVGPLPKWDGSALDGRTLLVYAIAGLGDTIQFARYLPLVAERASGRVLFECPPGLLDVLGEIPGIAGIVPRTGVHVSADRYISLLSLPALFDTTEETIPSCRIPIRIPDQATGIWRRRLAGLTGLKVGLCWSGDPSYPGDRLRSMHLEMFAPLAAIPGIDLVSLQLGPREQEVHDKSHGLRILHAPADLAPLSKTAALLRELDLVVSTCTAIPHLAGALGVETWLLLPFVPPPWWNVYRRDETPWYPCHRLFFQPRPGDWQSVIDRVAHALAARAAKDRTRISDADEPA